MKIKLEKPVSRTQVESRLKALEQAEQARNPGFNIGKPAKTKKQ